MKKSISIAGVVLAGGKSSRFGRDKSQLVLGGKSIVQAQLEKLAKAGCAPLFVVAHTTQRSDAPTLRRSVTILHDLHPNLGPIGGLHTALKATEADALFLVACDMPLLTVKTLRKIASEFTPHLDAVVPLHNGQREPLCAVYSRAILASVESHIQARNLAMQNLVQSLTTHYLDFSGLAKKGREFYNINTQKDYEQLKENI